MALIGKRIGILLFETAGERLCGDPGMPGTFDFPVEYGVVRGSYRDLVEGSDAARENLCAAAVELAKRGVSAIAGDCGLMALYQREIAAAANVPVLVSALLLAPLALSLLTGGKKLGIVTGHSALLLPRHLAAAGVDETRTVICGMETRPHFCGVVLEGTEKPQAEQMRRDALDAVSDMLKAHPEIGAILLECSNLAAFGRDIADAFNLPVFDMNTAARLLWDALERPGYKAAEAEDTIHQYRQTSRTEFPIFTDRG